MEVASLGLRTDLALLERSGSTIEDCGDHLVVRTPRNPTFWWGNFLVLDAVPSPERIDAWLDRFVAALPGARHRAIAFDCPDGTVDELAGFSERGFTADASSVMTARSVQPPPHPNTEATYRPFSSDDDWAQSVALALACHDGYEENQLEFVTRRAASNRDLVTDGYGAWFGAFVDGRLVTQMGLVRAGADLARFQSVETDPASVDAGSQERSSTTSARYGFAELGAETLVMVADPNDDAIRIYRTVGFTATESALHAELAPPADLAVDRREAVDALGVLLCDVRVETGRVNLAVDPVVVLRASAFKAHQRHAVSTGVGDPVDIDPDQ